MTPKDIKWYKNALEEGTVDLRDARNYMWRLLDELTEVMSLLDKLAKYHDGYQFGVGPCVCEWHEKARKLLEE